MRFRDDERGQSVQIGAVLLFATLIIAFSSYQAFVVPQQNQAVEFDHNQQVHGELQDLRNAIVSMPGGASTTATSVTLGTTYPSRAVAQNPGPASGSLRTQGTGDERVAFSIRNATATGETGDVWDGSLRSYDTGVVNYDPSYNVYQGAPLSVYEHSVLYNEFRSGTIVTADQTVVDGRTISLVAVNGSLERTSTGATSVDVRPVSSSQETVLVEAPDDDSPVTINLTSRLPAARWESLLDGETHVRSVTEQPSDAPDGFRTVRITLDPGETYRLQLTKVGVGTRVTSEGPDYLTDVEDDGTSVQQGQNTTLVVQVRDRVDNPVSGVEVNASAESGSVSPTADSDEEGRAAFDYRAPSGESGTVDVNFSYVVDPGADFDAAAPENVTTTLTVSGSGSGGGVGGSLAYDGNGVAFDGPDSNDAPGAVALTLENTHGSTVTVTDIEIEPADGAIDILADRVGGSGPARHEVYVDADAADGYVDFSDLTFGSNSADGTTVPREVNLNLDGRLNDGDPRVSSGGTATLILSEFFTDTDDAANVDMTGRSLDVVVSYRTATGRAYQTAFTATPTADGDGGGGSSNQAPSIDAFQTTDTSQTGGNPKYAQFDVDWAVSDDSDLASLELTMTRVSTGIQVDSATPAVSGTSASGTTTLREPDQSSNPSGQQYDITITVTDGDGATTTQTQRVTV